MNNNTAPFLKIKIMPQERYTTPAGREQVKKEKELLRNLFCEASLMGFFTTSVGAWAVMYFYDELYKNTVAVNGSDDGEIIFSVVPQKQGAIIDITKTGNDLPEGWFHPGELSLDDSTVCAKKKVSEQSGSSRLMQFNALLLNFGASLKIDSISQGFVAMMIYTPMLCWTNNSLEKSFDEIQTDPHSIERILSERKRRAEDPLMNQQDVDIALPLLWPGSRRENGHARNNGVMSNQVKPSTTVPVFFMPIDSPDQASVKHSFNSNVSDSDVNVEEWFETDIDIMPIRFVILSVVPLLAK